MMTSKNLDHLLGRDPAVLLWFYSETCGVCQSLRPKVEKLLKDNFPKVKLVSLHAGDHAPLAAQLRMLSLPGILFFLEGREVFRSNGLIAISELERQIARPYGLLFD